MAEFAWLQQNIKYPARQVRALVSELFTEGVLDLSGGSLLVSERSAGANMSVDVAAGRCVVVGDEQADQETYLCVFDDATNLTVASADPDQARKDRVIVRVQDSAVSGTSDGPIREVLTGTVGSGSAPAVPDSSISIAIVDVPAGANSITDNEIADDRSGYSVKGVLSDDPHGSGDHDGTVSDNPHGVDNHSEVFAAENNNLSDIATHSATDNSSDGAVTLFNVTSGPGVVLGGMVWGLLSSVTLTIDGTSNTLPVETVQDGNADSIQMAHVPPAYFDSSAKLDWVNSGQSTRSRSGIAHTRTF